MDKIYLTILILFIPALIGDLIRWYKQQPTYTKMFQDYIEKKYRFIAMCVLLVACYFIYGLQGVVPALCWVLVGHLAGF